MNEEEIKKVYEAKDIQVMLGISKNSAYAFLEQAYKEQQPFRVIKIGRVYRILKKDFDCWIDDVPQ